MILPTGKAKKALIESEILAAQSISKSEAEVARNLGVSYQTYKKYAKMYGVFGRCLNIACKGIKKPVNEDMGKFPLEQILEGKFPKYSSARLKIRLLRSGRIEKKCARCGFDEVRTFDGEVPLMLNYIDGNHLNKKRENLQMLCFNCFFLTVNNPVGRRKTFQIAENHLGEIQGLNK